MPDRRTRTIDHRRAFARFTGWMCLVAPAAVMVLILAQQGQPYRLAGPAAFALSGGLGLWLLRRNRNAAAFGVLSYGSWLATVIALSYSGGLHGNSALALPIIILFSAWLVGIRTMLLLGGATIAVLFGYAFLEMHGLLPVRAVTPILQRAFIMSVIVLTATALGYFVMRTLAQQMAALVTSRGELQKKMAALAGREKELSLMAEHVPAMIAHFDRDRTCRFANSAYAGFVGKTPESILGRRTEDIIGAAAYANIEPAIERVLGGEAVRLTASRVNAAGEQRSLVVELVPDIGSRGMDGWYALIRDITESERAAKSLRHIIDGTARATGTAFFRALTLNLAQATGLGRAMVAEVLPDRRHARALAYWDGQECRQGMEYLLKDAPCQQVIDEGEACFPDRVAELFPNDLALALHGIRGYYGARLESSDGVPLGVLVVMDNAPIRDRADIASLVSVFAARAAAELERLGAEAALRSTGERFASVFSTSPTPIAITVMAEGRFEDVNPAFEKTFGWSRNELLGRSAIDIGIWQSPAERERWVAELRTNHRTRDFETVHLTKTGEPLTILLSAETIEREGVLHIIAFARDETQRRRAEEAKRAALERFEAIFQHAPNVAIQGFDARGTIMHWNRASETLYGIPSDEAIGRPLQELLHTPDTVREFESVVADICASGMPSAPGEWPIPLRDGREIWVLSTMFPVFSEGMVAEIFCMDVDITDLKLANESVRRLNVELEARVAARTAELARLNKELEAFSYSVSHDLRAPLRSIEGFGRLLELDCADLLDATGRDYVSRMCRSAKRLAQLIDDLLDLTRIDRAEIRPVQLDLSTLAGEIVEELRQGAPERRVRIAIAPGLQAQGDPQLLRIALQNLLENAWKYSGRTAESRIEFGCEDSSGERVYYVQDNGAGFDMAYADKLFVPFQRLHSPHEFEGTGVGLASVSRVIKRHHGRIWAEAAPGQGATFFFTLS
ncbi:MAG: PAS domain S-box protein [Rhodocyclaceae bacterium]|jgi:PAS domain S-box-containing protein|nr:PAS domain S-box protein [Rhodocyclaceae bacterium]MCO5097958.1 PAS domain S-box protein [Rhodocyclaceae bacterium]